MQKSVVFALAAMVAGAAAAQGDARRDPASPQAKVPPVTYRSAFEGYRPLADEKMAPWRQSNEAVKSNGGHAGHAPDASAPSKPAARPPAGGAHGDHK
jgi:hypothetical protein